MSILAYDIFLKSLKIIGGYNSQNMGLSKHIKYRRLPMSLLKLMKLMLYNRYSGMYDATRLGSVVLFIGGVRTLKTGTK